MRTPRVVVIGAGVGGLVAALELARSGADVVVVEKGSAPGGKIREVALNHVRLDAGPTVFTMRWVFEEIFASVGARLSQCLSLRPVSVLARHAWSSRERLDLFASHEQTMDAIGAFAGPKDALGYSEFIAHARRIYETLDQSFMRSPEPNLTALVGAAGRKGSKGLRDLYSIEPFTPLWRALARYFQDQRLRQLFGRYATYCGSSPFLCPATLMLVAHVEQAGVWLVDGGMQRLAHALADLAVSQGCTMRYECPAAEVLTRDHRVAGVVLEHGERLPADAVVVNADVNAVAWGRFGPSIAGAVAPIPPSERSLSAVTWNLLAETEGFPLIRHTVFFSQDYRAEFDDIFRHRRLPEEPTVYVCAQDRGGHDEPPPPGAERLLCLVNAPAIGDQRAVDKLEIKRCEERAFELLSRCGLTIRRTPTRTVMTAPQDFEQMFPATGGALYGRASHGWTASFRRPGSRTRIPGLYLAGGSAHPGPGVPMAALSGRLAAGTLLADLASTG